MIHVSYITLAKVRLQDTKKYLKEVQTAVIYLGKDHALTPAIKVAMREVETVENLLDQTYGKCSHPRNVTCDKC